MEGDSAIPKQAKNRAQVISTEVEHDVEMGPPKAPERSLNLWKFSVVIGFCIYVGLLGFYLAFRPGRMVPVISPLKMVWGVGPMKGSNEAVCVFLIAGVLCVVMTVLMFLEPLMTRILGDWLWDVNDGTGIGGCFARGLFFCRPPPGSPGPEAMQKGKFWVALTIAALGVLIPDGLFGTGPHLLNTTKYGFPIDGNIVKDNICETFDLGCNKMSFDAMCYSDDAWPIFMASFSPDNCPPGVAEAGAWVGGDGPKHFNGVWTKNGACPSAPPHGTGVCAGASADATYGNCNLAGCNYTDAFTFYKPSAAAESLIELNQLLNAPGFFFIVLLIDLPFIIYLALPCVMGPLSCGFCGWWTSTPGCFNCLTPACECMEGRHPLDVPLQ